MINLNDVIKTIVGANQSKEDNDLYFHLVGSLFSTKATIISANIMGVGITLCAFLVTNDIFFLTALLLISIAGVSRTAIANQYAKKLKSLKNRNEYEYYDTQYFIRSTIFSLIIGVTCWKLITFQANLETHELAAGAAVGYALAFVSRNSGRPNLVIAQVIASISPIIFGYFMGTSEHTHLYGLLLSGVLLCYISISISLNANIVSVYRETQKASYLARNDTLTDLFNRYTLSEYIKAAIETNPKTPFAVMYLDLDRFKEINDTLGHKTGDDVIKEMGSRIKKTISEQDMIARFGGDEFLIKIAYATPATINPIAKRLSEMLSEPFEINGQTIHSSASIGISYYPDHGSTIDDLIKNADMALYEAKKDNVGGWRSFDSKIEAELSERRTLEHDMRRAIESREFIPYFQPIYNLQNHKVVSFEALARWVHPVRGMINPAIFITIAEQTGMIEAIGAQMLKDSCAAAKKWPDEISVAVNISPIQFKKPESLIKAVKEALRSTKLPARRLHLEITESLLIHDPAQTRKTMEELIEIGVKLSLDDFGTGFSSLSYIMNYPFSKIKIDKAFTDRLSTNDPAPPLIIQAITYIAAGLSFDVVAEGIETQNQEDQIRKLGPTLGQGYLFSKPVSIEKTLEFFESHKQSVQKIA